MTQAQNQPETQAKGNLSDEQYQKVFKSQDFSELSAPQIEEFINRMRGEEDGKPDPVAPDVVATAPQGTSPEEPPKTSTEGEAQANPSDEKKDKFSHVPETPVDEVTARKYVEKADEANTFKQQLEATKKKLENAQRRNSAIEEALKTLTGMQEIDEKSLFTEDGIKNIARSQKQLVKATQTILAANKEEVAEHVNDSKEAELFLTIAEMQVANPELKTSVPVRELNKAYVNFSKQIGGVENLNRYMTDPEYRKTQEMAGNKIPIQDGDLKAFSRILEVHSESKIVGNNDLTYTYWKLKNSGRFPTEQSAPKTSPAVAPSHVEARNNPKVDTPVLTPGVGITPDTGDPLSSREASAKWLNAHPKPKTKAEWDMVEAITEKWSNNWDN